MLENKVVLAIVTSVQKGPDEVWAENPPETLRAGGAGFEPARPDRSFAMYSAPAVGHVSW